jgi:hypothetical protein
MARIGAHRRRGLTGVALACLAAAGCGGGTGALTGQVSYKGKSVVSGSVVLIGSDGTPRYSGIRPDGTYRFTGVPAGEARLGVNSPNPVPDPRKVALARAAGKRGGRSQDDPITSTPTSDPRLWFPIPRAAGDPATSHLGTTIRRGENTHNIELH